MDNISFGAIERKYIDTVKDYNLAKATAVIDTIPATFLPDYSLLPVYMQGKTPTCGSHALAFFKCVQEFIETGKPQDFSRRFPWINIKMVDGYPINLDTGTDTNAIMKVATSIGICDSSLMNDDITLPFDVYSSPSALTQEQKDNAQPRVVDKYAFQKNPSMLDIKKAIYQNKVVIMTLRLGEEFWTDKNGNGSWQEKDILPLRVPKQVVSAHFVTAWGYDEKYIYFRNSWSKDWGRSGDGYFGIEYIPYVAEIATAVDLSDGYVKKLVMQRTILQKLVILYQQLLKQIKGK